MTRKAVCSIRGLINDLTRTLMGTMLHLDDLLLRLDNDSEEFGEAWLANQQLQRSLEFFLELRSEYMICHENKSNSQCKIKYNKLTTTDKILHRYNNIFEFILGSFEVLHNDFADIRINYKITKQISAIIQDAKILIDSINYQADNNDYFSNKLPINLGEFNSVNTNKHNNIYNKKVFLVEDNELVKNLLANILRKHKYYVIECSNGETALAKFEPNKSIFITCIIDIGLPDIEGPDLFKKLLLINNNINVLYISGYSDKKIKQKFPLINKHHIMTKPFHLVDFVNKIKSITL